MGTWFEGISNALSGGGFTMGEGDVMAATRDLEDALKKSMTGGVAGVGYQTAPGMSGDDVSPLLLQSVDDQLANATTYSDTDFVIFDRMPKDQAKQTLHEIRRHVSHGDRFIDMAAAEGEAGINDFSTFEADSVQIKFWTARREMSYVAANIPGQATLVKGSLLALYTKEAMTQLLRSVEIDTIHGDSALNPLKTDGLIKQIKAKGNVTDLNGRQLTFDAIERKLAEVSNVDVGAKPTHMFVTPNVWHDLSRQAQDGKERFDNTGTTHGRNFTFGSTGLEVFSPDSNRRIKVEKAPFLDDQRAYSSPYDKKTAALYASYDPKGGFAPGAITVSSKSAGADASSKFAADDAGTFYYHIMGVNAYGHSAAVATSTQAVAAGEIATILLDVPSPAPKYYHVFRSTAGGAATTSRFLFSVAHNTSGAGGKVSIVDSNAVRQNCSRVLMLNLSGPEELAFYRLLPLARIPLAQVELKIPFVLFMSGACKVKVPEKQVLWENVGVANPL